MRTLLFVCLVALVAGVAPLRQAQAGRILFVGNSLTYVGNVPAVYSALAAANGQSAPSDMIVQGGATLTHRVADGSVARALSGGEYTALVLQERGGDLMCSFGPDSCVQSRQAIRQLAALGRQNGAKVLLLGSYQPHPAASRRLIRDEARAAAEAGIPYIEVSERLRRLRNIHSQLSWFASDGMHPGKDLALLNGLLVYEAVQGSLPAAQPLVVQAPVYGVTSGLEQALRASDAPPPLPDTPMEVRYPSDTMEKLLGVLKRAPRR